MYRITCTNPQHKDSTPSMSVYQDGGFCFSCGYIDRSVADKEAPKREPEDITKTLEYIRSLPTREYRGLEFPSDSLGVYLVYPSGSYYKKRLYSGDVRYIGPKGIKAPLFIYQGSKNVLVLVEGEINCITLKTCLPDCPWTIASPGSASEFSKAIDFSKDYAIVIVVVDKDPAGVSAGISFKKEMLKWQKEVHLLAVSKDYNDTLQETGPEAVKREFQKGLGLSS